MSDIGDLIKEHRLACNLSQKKLGDACSISDAEIMRIENGDRKTPSWSNLCKIAKALKMHPFQYLLISGYIEEKDIHPSVLLTGLDQLNADDVRYLQLMIDFIISRKCTDENSKEGCNNAISIR